MGRREAERWRRKGAHRRCGLVILVEELAIGLLSELQWLVGMLFMLRIGRGKQWWRLTMVSRGRGGGPLSGGDQNREKWLEKKCATIKMWARGARENARGPEEDVPMRKQVLAPGRRAWQPRRSSGRSSATWRTHGKASTGSGGQRHGRRVTRGTSEGRRWRGWCDDGEPRRSTARAGSRATCRGGDKPARGLEAAGQRPGWHVARSRAAQRCRGGAHGRENGGGARQRRTEEREREVDEEGPGCKF
jgi:hypothetical protein